MSSQKYVNVSSVPLSLAVFLATDNYDHDPNTISATSLIKPIRQIILGGRVPPGMAMPDLTQMVASRMGSAIHDGIERSWLFNHVNALAALGIPERVISNVRVNPTRDYLLDNPDTIPVYLEQRAQRQVGKYLVSGKFDFVGDGRVEDFKTTGTYTAMHNTNDAKHVLQGSIYRWLNPDIITKDTMAIQYIFTDWSSMSARQNPKYPQQRFMERIHPLMGLEATDIYVRQKLNQFDALVDVAEELLPHCTDEDLWRSEPVFKYYKNPDSTKRSTKNFATFQEAMTHKAMIGVGIVVEKPGNVSACKYCPGFTLCSQKDELIASGDLVL